ncbi:MAG: HDOD domain-containing protein [Acidobacteriota bacterium]
MIVEQFHPETRPFPIQHRIDIEELVSTKVPMMPGSAARISSLLNDVNASSKQLTDAITYDPILTARILRLANSPIYSLQKNVSTLRHAIEVVGMKAIYEILIIGLAADSFAKEIRNSEKGRKIWEHSLAVALLSRELGHSLKLRGTEEAFICGLLHDIGKILLLKNDFQQFSETLLVNDEMEMLQAESNMFGYNHAQIGSLVASRWGLPDGVCHTILNHHDPSQSEQFQVNAHLISVSDTIANAKGFGLRDVQNENFFGTESTIMLSLTAEQVELSWEKTLRNIAEIKSAF